MAAPCRAPESADEPRTRPPRTSSAAAEAVEAERDALLKPVSEGGPDACGDAGAAEGDGTGIYGNTLV